MNTSNADRVISETPSAQGVPATDAHAIALITYRQLDHWARQAWVRPSLDEGHGRAGRRRYARSDVVRLDLLRHLAKSGVNLTVSGPVVATLSMPDRHQRVVWGPLGVRDEEPEFHVVAPEDIAGFVERPGSWVVYSAERVNSRFDEATNAGVSPTAQQVPSKRRLA